MGRPLLGIKATVVQHIKGEAVKIINSPNIEGELALKIGWPSIFRGYLNEEERYKNVFLANTI